MKWGVALCCSRTGGYCGTSLISPHLATDPPSLSTSTSKSSHPCKERPSQASSSLASARRPQITMRTELLLFFCLACLALTAQAAPAAIEDALHRDYNGGKHTSKQKHHRHDHEKHHHGKKPGHPDRSRKTTRAVNGGEIHAADEAASHLFPQEHLLPKYRDKLAAAEAARREENKLKLHQMQVEDAIYMASTARLLPSSR